MDLLHPRGAGLDVPERTVVATGRRVEPAGAVAQTTRTVATRTRALLALAEGMAAQGVTVVALESTGTSWKPGFNLLDGRQTDVKESQGMAPLLHPGLSLPSPCVAARPS